MRKFNVKVNGQPYEVEVEEINGGATATTVQTAPVQSAPTPAPAPKATSVGEGVQLKAPMPGTILDFKVNSGTAVKKGQAVAILEAMKMENEVAANADGTIEFSIAKGAEVNTGDIIAVIK